MSRLISTMRLDLRLQFRNGFYYAAIFVVVIFTILLRQLPQDVVTFLLPPFLLTNMVINTFYFVAGLVLLEKGEGTLEAQIVTPLRTREYLTSKAVTLSIMSLVEAMLIVALTRGLDLRWLPLIAAILMVGPLYVLIGFTLVSRYDSLNEYLFPSFIYTMFFSIPLIYYFGLWSGPLFYLHPLQPALVLLQAAFEPVATWKLAYGILYLGFWVWIAYLFSRRAFYRFVIVKEGVRA